jgi:hypothetical protein
MRTSYLIVLLLRAEVGCLGPVLAFEDLLTFDYNVFSNLLCPLFDALLNLKLIVYFSGNQFASFWNYVIASLLLLVRPCLTVLRIQL